MDDTEQLAPLCFVPMAFGKKRDAVIREMREGRGEDAGWIGQLEKTLLDRAAKLAGAAG